MTENVVIENKGVRTENGLTYTEIDRQAHRADSFVISSGFVDGEGLREFEACYLQIERENETPIVLLLRPDEMRSIARFTSNTIWSFLTDNPQGFAGLKAIRFASGMSDRELEAIRRRAEQQRDEWSKNNPGIQVPRSEGPEILKLVNEIINLQSRFDT